MRLRKSSKAVILALAFLLAVSFAAAAFADFPENFDGYTSGTTSPLTAGNPWTCKVDGVTGSCGTHAAPYSDCFTGTGVFYNGGAPTPNSYSPPNVYSLAVVNNATCFGGVHYVQLSASLNTTQIGLIVSFFRLALVNTTTAVNATVFLCNTKVFSHLLNAEPSVYTKLTQSANGGAISSTCTVIFRLYTTSGGTPLADSWRFDNVVVKGANAIYSSANFIMLDQASGSWFNMSNYANSYVTVNYGTSLPPVIYSTAGFNGIASPDMVLNTVNAMSISVNLGSIVVSGTFYPGYTTQMLLPSGCTIPAPCKIYLAAPQTPVFAYAFAITDLSGKFPTNSTVTITQGTHLFSSGYTDQLGYAASLVPGKYTFTLTNGPNTYSTIVNLPAVAGYTQPIQILKLSVGGSCGGACSVGYDARFDASGANVVAVFNDTNLGTNIVKIGLEKTNASGTFELSTSTFTGTYGTLQNSIACNSNQCNTTLAAQLYVSFSFSGSDGSGTANVPVSGGGAPAGTPNIPTCILQWCATFPTITPLQFITYGLTIAFAAIFGAYSAKFGAIVVSILVAAFTWFGWMQVPQGFVTLIVALSVTAFIAYLEGGR